MAANIEKTETINLGGIVQSGIDAFVVARNKARAVRSSEFYQTVIDQGLSTDEQVSYFKGWLKEEENKGVNDEKFINELKESIYSLQKISRSEKFYNEYRTSFEELKTSKKGIDEHLRFLENQKDMATDTDLQVEIDKLIATTKVDKFTAEKNILTNQTTLALNDKRESSLMEMINKITKAKNNALIGGDKELASSYDINLQALNSQLDSTRMTDEVHSLEVDMMNRPFSPVEFLNELTDRIERAGTNAPITVNGVKYDSAKQYWEMKMNDYVEKDFISMMESDIKTKIDTATIKLTPVLEKEIEKNYNDVEELKSNHYLQPYLEKIDGLQLRSSAYGVDQLGSKVVRDYQQGKLGDTASSNVSNAINKLVGLNKKYGVDVSSSIDTIFSDVSEKKSAVASQQIKTYQDAIAEGQTPEEAWKTAQGSVFALDITPEETVTTDPLDIAKRTIDSTTKRDEGTPDPADISETPVDAELPTVSKPEEQQPQRGELIPYKELLGLVDEKDIERDGTSIYLKGGVTAPYRKLKGESELKPYEGRENELIRPTGTTDIFVKQ